MLDGGPDQGLGVSVHRLRARNTLLGPPRLGEVPTDTVETRRGMTVGGSPFWGRDGLGPGPSQWFFLYSRPDFFGPLAVARHTVTHVVK